jgi:hypothetical protein
MSVRLPWGGVHGVRDALEEGCWGGCVGVEQMERDAGPGGGVDEQEAVVHLLS